MSTAFSRSYSARRADRSSPEFLGRSKEANATEQRLGRATLVNLLARLNARRVPQGCHTGYPTSLSSADYFAGRDPALEAAGGFPQQSGFGDIIENLLKSGGGLGSLQRLYVQRKSDPAWAGESTKDALQRLGTYLISKKLYQGAFMTFAANVREYPDSLAAAIQAAETAQAQYPDDKGAADLVKRLSALRGQR